MINAVVIEATPNYTIYRKANGEKWLRNFKGYAIKYQGQSCTANCYTLLLEDIK